MKYRVVTRVVEECIYEVEADDPKSAEAKSVDATPYATETLQEETLSITEVKTTVGPYCPATSSPCTRMCQTICHVRETCTHGNALSGKWCPDCGTTMPSKNGS